MCDERWTETKLEKGGWETKRPKETVTCMCLTMTARAHTQFKSDLLVKSHTVVLMRDQWGHQLVPLWQSWISFDRPAVTMAWQVCFHGNTFVTCVERGQSVGGESPMRTVGLEGKLITLMMIQSVSWGRMRKTASAPLVSLSFPWNWNLGGLHQGFLLVAFFCRRNIQNNLMWMLEVKESRQERECQCCWELFCGGSLALN